MRRFRLAIVAVACIASASAFVLTDQLEGLGNQAADVQLSTRTADGGLQQPQASAYKAATPQVDDAGVVSLVSEDGSRYYHPFNIATQALADNGVEGTAGLYFEAMVSAKPEMSSSQRAAMDWLVENKRVLPNGAVVWSYPLPLYYTTFTIEPGWPSAFSQARIIHALMYAARVTGEDTYLRLAVAAAHAYGTPVEDGGLLDSVDGLPFFEEVPVQGGHSPHILNGHLYSLIALFDLARETGDATIKELAENGANTAAKLAPYYDTGIWTKYDLVPRVASIQILVQGRGQIADVSEGGLLSKDGDRFPLELVSVSDSVSTFRVNLPGTMFINRVIGHPGYTLRLNHSEPIAAVGIAGTRPDVDEFYELPMIKDGQEDSGASLYKIPIQYLSDSVLSRIYQRWHSRLMKRLAEVTGELGFKEIGDRWWMYDQQLEKIQQQNAPENRVIIMKTPVTTDSR